MPRNIAIVEDEPLIRANYVEALNRLGYATRGYATRAQASVAFAAQLPDLVINDVGLADEPEGAFDLCRELRARSSILPPNFVVKIHMSYDSASDHWQTQNFSYAGGGTGAPGMSPISTCE